MATFSADVYQNEFLPDGGTDVHAIVTVTCSGAGEAGQSESGDAAEIVIVDTSGSMGEDKIAAVQQAAAAALDQVLDGVWFAVIAGNHEARLAYPAGSELGMVRMDERDPRRGQGRGSHLLGRRRHRDGHLADAGHQRVRLGPGARPEARHPADRRDQPARDPGAAQRRDRGCPRPVPVRLPRSGRRLAGGGGPPDRHRPARQRRPDRPAGADGRRLRAESCGSRWAAASPRRPCGCGLRRAPRSCSSGRSPRRSRTSHPDGRRSTR